MPGTNTLAYLASSSAMKEKSFITLDPGDSLDEGEVVFDLLFPLVLPDGNGDHRSVTNFYEISPNLVIIVAHFSSKFDQTLPNFVKSGRNLTSYIKFYQKFLNFTEFYQILIHFNKFCRIFQDFIKICNCVIWKVQKARLS